MKKLKTSLWIILAMVIIAILILPVLLNKESETLNPETRKEAPGQFIDLPNGITHYEAAGTDTAQTVLLVAGFSVPYYMWDPTFEFLKQNGFRVIRFDFFGRGYSDRPDLIYNGELFTQQIYDLLTGLNIDKPVDIIGISMGGPVVAEFTARYPEKVRKVTLIAPVNESKEISVLNIPVLGEYVVDVFLAPLFPAGQSKDFYRPGDYTDRIAMFRPQMKYKGFKRALLSTLRNYMNIDKIHLFAEMGKLNKEILLIWGEYDKTTPFTGNERIRAVVECEFLHIEESGHLPHIEHPDLVNARIFCFLNE
jgi:pimeloyl-ACP methyl ester carboxylesterase